MSTPVDAPDGDRPQPGGVTVHPRPAWRRALYRFRHLIAAVAALAAILVVVGALAPGVTAYALAGDAPAGTVLTPAHLAHVRVPHNALPAGYLATPPVGEQLLIDLPAHTVLSRHLLTSESLADGAPAGTLVFPIELADPGSLALARVGSIVTIVAADPSLETVRAIDGVTIIAVFDQAQTGILGSTDHANAVAVVAVPREQANFVLSASGPSPVRIAITP